MIRIVFTSALAALLLLRTAAAGAEDEFPETRASIQIETRRTRVYVGEVVELSLEILYDRPWFEEHAAALFRQPMDVPVRAVVPAFQPPDGLRAFGKPPPTWLGDGVDTFALGDQVVQGAPSSETLPSHGARPQHGLRVNRIFQVTREGVIDLGAPSLEFAWAQSFETDLLGERTPAHPQRVTVLGPELRLTAVRLPVEGRPASFRGWIGRYGLAMGAKADRTELVAGDPVRLTVTIDGEGNDEELPIPAFDDLRGFHVLGALDERTPHARTLQIDLAPLDAAVVEIPALSLWFFDPQRGSYQESRSKPIPLTVKGAVRPTPPPPAPPPAEAPPQESNWFLPAILAFVILAGVCVWLWKRSLAPPGTTSAAVSLEPALVRLRAAAHAGSPGESAALLEVLAQHLKTAPAALVDANLGNELEASGLPRPLAERAAAAVEAGIAARYAGPHAAPATLPPGLVEELEQALRAPRSV